MGWVTESGRRQWKPEQAERVSAVSDASNPNVTRLIGERIQSRKSTAQPGRRAASSGPSPKQYEDILGMVVIGATTVFAWVLVNDVPHTEDDVQRLAMNDDEAKSVVTPLSKIIANSWIGSRYGEKIIGSEDYVAMVFVVFMYMRRTWPAVLAKIDRVKPKMKPRGSNDTRQRQPSGQPSGQPNGTGSPNMAQASRDGSKPLTIYPTISDT